MKTNYTLCDFASCPLKETCARFLDGLDRTKTDHFSTMPYKESKGECRFYEPYDDLNELNIMSDAN